MYFFIPLVPALATSLILAGCGESGDRGDSAVRIARDSSGAASIDSSDNTTESGEAESDSVTITLFMAEPSDSDRFTNDETFGCGDVLAGETRTIPKQGSPLEGAVRALLAPENDGPTNYVAGGSVVLDSATVRDGIARIYLQGHFALAGVCDHPRIQEQLRATALQFPEVDSVMVFVGSERLEDYLSLK